MATKVNPGPQAGEVVDFPGTGKHSPQMPYPSVGPRVRGDPQLSGVTSGEEGRFPGKAMELRWDMPVAEGHVARLPTCFVWFSPMFCAGN